MSNPDSFIDEVTEEVRRDRLFRVFRRYGWIGVVLVVAVVGGAAWTEWQKAQARARAEALGDAVLSALDTQDAAARLAALQPVSAQGDAAVMLALLALSEATASADPTARSEALARVEAAAAAPGVSPLWQDMAELRRLSVPGAAIDKAALQALAAPGRPFRVLAQELLAVDKLASGDRDGALADFRTLSQDAEAPSALRARATQMIVVLGGETAQPGQD